MSTTRDKYNMNSSEISHVILYVKFELNHYYYVKDNQMRSPTLLSGPKIRKAYFEVSNPKMLLHRPPLKSNFKGLRGVIEVTLLDLKPQNRLY